MVVQQQYQQLDLDLWKRFKFHLRKWQLSPPPLSLAHTNLKIPLGRWQPIHCQWAVASKLWPCPKSHASTVQVPPLLYLLHRLNAQWLEWVQMKPAVMGMCLEKWLVLFSTQEVFIDLFHNATIVLCSPFYIKGFSSFFILLANATVYATVHS